jgi:hypothetical protein
LTPKELGPLRVFFEQKKTGGSYENSFQSLNEKIHRVEWDCLERGYLKEYSEIVSLTGLQPPEEEVKRKELNLAVMEESEKYHAYCRTTGISPTTEEIEEKEKELVNSGKWRKYVSVRNVTGIKLSQKQMSIELIRHKQEGLLGEGNIPEYLEMVMELGVTLPKPKIKEILGGFLIRRDYEMYQKLSAGTKIKLSKKEKEKLNTDGSITKDQLEIFARGLDAGDLGDFISSHNHFGFMPAPEQIQAVQMRYLLRSSVKSGLDDPYYKQSVEATGIEVSLDSMKLLKGLANYR